MAATFTVAAAIITESTLSFFGFGVQPARTSAGATCWPTSKAYVGRASGGWWSSPAWRCSFTILAINFIGDGLRDALDPKQAKERA